MTYGYLRVSTLDQDVDKHRKSIIDYERKNDLEPMAEMVTERTTGMADWRIGKLGQLIDRIEKGDVIIVPALSRLGRSLPQIAQIAEAVDSLGAQIHFVREGLVAPGVTDLERAQYRLWAIFAQLERELISERTSEALAAKKAKGVKLGRPAGPRASKLDPHKETIMQKLQQGVTQRRIAKDLDVTPAHLNRYIGKHGLDKIPAVQWWRSVKGSTERDKPTSN